MTGLVERLGGARRVRDAARGVLLFVGAVAAVGTLAGGADAYLTETLGFVGTGALAAFLLTTGAGLVRELRVDTDESGGAPDTTHLHLYQAEGCPYCATVRQFCTEHGLSLTLHNPRTEGTPVTGGTVTNRDRHAELTGHGQDRIPLLVDAEHGESLYESDDIVAYLRAQYVERGGD